MKLINLYYLFLVFSLIGCKEVQNHESAASGSQHGLTSSGYQEQAEQHLEREQLTEAYESILAAIQMDSTDPQNYILLADIELAMLESLPALKTLQKAAAMFPGDVDIKLHLARLQLILKQYTEAEATLNDILTGQPVHAEAFLLKGLVYRDLERYNEAIAQWKLATASDPYLPEAWLLLGQTLEAAEEPEAGDYYKGGLNANKGHIPLKHALALFLQRRGELEEAKSHYQEIILLDSTYTDALYNLGLLYLEQDSIQLALKALNAALQVDPLYIKAFLYRGIAYEELGQEAEALQDYRLTLQMYPDHPVALDGVKRLGD